MKRLMLSLGVSLIAWFPGFSAPLHKTVNNHSARFFQHATISGKVTDNKGQPLAGVTVSNSQRYRPYQVADHENTGRNAVCL